GHMSTTTTIIDGKNGSVPSSSMKVGKKSLTEDLVTTFSSPAAWILVVALIVTWSAVAIVVFDLVDYKNLAGRSVNKLSTEPLRIIHETLEETTDWLYGFLSFLSDIIWSDDDDSDEGICNVETSVTALTPVLHALLIHKDKPEKQEKVEKKEPERVSQKEKLESQEKPEKKERHADIHKEKPEKSEKREKKAPAKEEKKVKSTKVEAKAKKEVKDGKEEAKTEKAKQAETKTTEVGLIKAKTKVKEEKALQTITKSEKKDQYAFCRYVIDMFAQGDFYPGHKDFVPPRLLLEHSQGKK
ncbi:Triadin, partial [Calypte anna]